MQLEPSPDSRVSSAKHETALDTLLVGGIRTVRTDRAGMARRMLEDCLRARLGNLPLPRLVFSSNGSVIAAYHRSATFRSVLDQADFVDADGMPLVMATRLFCRHPLRERIATTDFIHDACAVAAPNGFRFYFLGAAPGVAESSAKKLRRHYPGLQIVGTKHGFFDRSEVDAICAELCRLRVDVLWIGLGSPYQETFAAGIRERLAGVAWIRTCGGLFDHLAGTIPRAPAWMQAAGLEWLHRAIKEPRRLGMRYLTTNPIAAYHLLTKTRDVSLP